MREGPILTRCYGPEFRTFEVRVAGIIQAFRPICPNVGSFSLHRDAVSVGEVLCLVA